MQEIPTPKRLVLDVRGPLDESDLDRIARLQLAARRLGISIAVRDATGRVRDLIALCGLDEVLPVVEIERQSEAGEEIGVDEEVDRGDSAV